MRFILVLVCVAFAAPAHSQLLDSIGLFLEEPPRFIARLDIRGSFISNSNVRFIGAKVGLEHARRFQYGVGYSFLLSPVEQTIIVEGKEEIGRLNLGYVTPYVDYAFYQRGPWEVRIPVQFGIGAGSVVYRDEDGRRRTWHRSGILLYEPAMTVQYRLFRYGGVGAGWGYRLVMHTHDDLGERLTAPIYIIGVRIFFGDIWRDIQAAKE